MITDTRTIATLIAAAAGLWIPAGQAADDAETLANAARCTMCHDAQAQRLGPSWAAIAERYGSEEGALETLAARTRAGGSGEWGKAPMPAVSEEQLSDEELEVVLRWVLER